MELTHDGEPSPEGESPEEIRIPDRNESLEGIGTPSTERFLT